MKYLLLSFFLTSIFAGNGFNTQAQAPKETSHFTIRHTVVFRFKQALDSPQIKAFFSAAKKLATISGVQNFECLKQISQKNNFEYGLSMEFSSQQIYDEYLSHPIHVNFLKEFWLKDVGNFMEIDYKPLI